MKWEYKIEEYATKLASVKVNSFLGQKQMLSFRRLDDKKPLTTEEVENRFNYMGNDSWELCGIIPLTRAETANPGGSNTERVHFIFKRQKQ